MKGKIKLLDEQFRHAREICDFINNNGIEREDIQCIVTDEVGLLYLFWWSEKMWFEFKKGN